MNCVGTQVVVVKDHLSREHEHDEGAWIKDRNVHRSVVLKKTVSFETLSEEIAGLAVAKKLCRGQLHSITREDVTELFKALKHDERAELIDQDLAILAKIPELKLTDSDILELVRECDVDMNGRISVDELYSGFLHSNLAAGIAIRNLQSPNMAATRLHQCKTQDLLKFLDDEHATRSAYRSLPWTFAFFFAWVSIVVIHLSTETAYSVQASLHAEVTGEGRPYLLKYVHDAPTFWDWMDTSFIGAHFKYNLQAFPFPGRVASFNQIIGGIQLARTNSKSELCQQSPKLGMAYDTQFGGRCYRTADTHIDSEYLLYHVCEQDIKEQLTTLRNSEWFNQNTTVLDMLVLFYNAHNNAFTSYQLRFDMQDASGLMKILWNMETFLADPYHNGLRHIPDVIFILLLVKMLYDELKNMVPAMLAGIDAFSEYLEFFTIVEWLVITLGIVMIFLWGTTVTNVGRMRDIIGELPTKALDEAVLRNSTFLTSEQFATIATKEAFTSTISDLHAKMSKAAWAHRNVRVCAYWYTFALMIKFFKSFRANPQLNVVIVTLTDVASDVAHFVIVFGTIFWVFSTNGHIIFGRSIKGFRNLWESASTCWSFLMGDYQTEPLPRAGGWLACVWIVSFQSLMTLILLNMLLAIIMQQYVVVKANIAGGASIAKQVKDMLIALRTQRHFVNMWPLICNFSRCHPDEKVTPTSLVEAFGMSLKQAQYLIDQTIKYIAAQQGEAIFSFTDAIKHTGHMKSIAMKITTTWEKTNDLLQTKAIRPKDAGLDKIVAGRSQGTLPKVKTDTNDDEKLLLKIGQLQEATEAMSAQVWQDKRFGETHYPWLEDRVSSVINKCNRATIAAEACCRGFDTVELSKLMEIPSTIDLVKHENECSTRLRRCSNMDSSAPSKVELQLLDLNLKAGQLLAQAQDQEEMRKMIRRIDSNLESLINTVPPPPQRLRAGYQQ